MFEVSRYGAIGATHVHLITALGLIVSAVFVLTLPRRYVAMALLPAMTLTPIGENINIAGVSFQMLRFMIFVGALRAVCTSVPDVPWRKSPIDFALLAWVVVSSLTFCLLYQQSGAIINRAGMIYNILGVYVLARFFVRDHLCFC